jgi:hypothetical protein
MLIIAFGLLSKQINNKYLAHLMTIDHVPTQGIGAEDCCDVQNLRNWHINLFLEFPT